MFANAGISRLPAARNEASGLSTARRLTLPIAESLMFIVKAAGRA
jgi:hypothetical protein